MALNNRINGTDIDFGQEPMAGEALHTTLVQLKAQNGPVQEVRFHGMPALLIYDQELLRAAFKNERDYPPADIYRFGLEPLIGRNFQTMEGAEHRLHRQLATPSFKPSVLRHFDLDYLKGLGNELIDRFIDRDEVDLAAEFTHLFPFIVISRLLGLPRDKENQFQRWALGILSFTAEPDQAIICRDELEAYLKPIVKERRLAPTEDIISALTQVNVDGKTLSDREILSTLHLMFSAGASTTHDAMGNLIYGLLTNRLWSKLKTDDGLIGEAIEEVLRWETPVALLPRTVRTDAAVDIAGVTIPAGSVVLFALCGANRDPSLFPEPDSFSPGAHDYAKTLTFGLGYRMCPGMHLARLQLKAMLQVLVDRLPDIKLIDAESALPQGSIIRGPKELRVSINR
jgi:cytochrome P450